MKQKANVARRIAGLLRWAERVWPMSGARAQRGRMERGAAKPRGRGLGQRNRTIFNLTI